METRDRFSSLLEGRQNIENCGGTTSAGFKQWVSKIRAEMRKLCKSDGQLLSFSVGHYNWSCFIQSKQGQIWYISCPDVRHLPKSDIIYRTAKHAKDYSGGGNRWVKP